MAWTATSALRNHLAGTGSLASALQSGSLRIFNAGAQTLVTCPITNVSVVGNQLVVTYSAAAVGVGLSNESANNAALRNSAGVALMTTNSVGGEGADIPFNEHTGWNAGDMVAPGASTHEVSVNLSAG